jgi:hypothetical protein
VCGVAPITLIMIGGLPHDKVIIGACSMVTISYHM